MSDIIPGFVTRPLDMALEAPWIVISLAGPRAERMWLRRELNLYPCDDELLSIICAVRNGWEEEADGDDGDTFRHLIDLHPDVTDEELIALYRRYETETLALLEEPDIWSAIERVAAELIKHGKIRRSKLTGWLTILIHTEASAKTQSPSRPHPVENHGISEQSSRLSPPARPL